MDVEQQTPMVRHHDLPVGPVQVPRGSMVVLIDASWDLTKKVGTAIMVFDYGGVVTHVQYNVLVLHDPLQAEAEALKEALQHLNAQQRGQRYVIYSDCKNLVQAVTTAPNNMEVMSWHAVETIAWCAKILQEARNDTQLKHVTREVQQAPHRLANLARITGQSLRRLLNHNRATEIGVELELNRDSFQYEDGQTLEK